MLTVFPVSDRRGIYAEFGGQLLLGKPSYSAGVDEASWKSSRLGRGIVSQEADDGWNVLDRGLGCAVFPIGDGQRMHPDPLGDLLLEESEVNPAGADMVS